MCLCVCESVRLSENICVCASACNRERERVCVCDKGPLREQKFPRLILPKILVLFNHPIISIDCPPCMHDLS